MRAEVEATVQLSQQSILDFLAGTGLPLVSRLQVVVRALALGLCLASLVAGVASVAIWPAGFWSATLPWSGGLPALVAAPLYGLAYRAAAQQRIHAAAALLCIALVAFTALVSWPHGPFHPGWYLLPVLVLLATSCVGITTGLSLALVAVVVLLVHPLSGPGPVAGPADGIAAGALWSHTASLAAVTLASALTGALVHKLLRLALENAELARRRQQQAAAALHQREKLLRHAMRIETVGDLAGLVTHQLRNAFQVMQGHVALGAMPGSADSVDRLAQVGEALRDSRPLLDQLLSLAHPEDGEPQRCELNAFVQAFAERAVRVLPASIEIGFGPAAEPVHVRLDPRGLEQALWNLVLNARHAMRDGGALQLRTGVEDGCGYVAVADNGCGIPPEVQPRIFDPYFTTKPPGQGTGLGLAAVDRFVRSSHGSVRLDSRPGQGTTFWLRFPRADDVDGSGSRATA